MTAPAEIVQLRYDNSVPTFHVENFGCRATQADGAALERQFESRGHAHASAAQAELVILNTCTVTNSADQDARAAIRRVRRQNPQAKIIVTGCYAQRAPAEIAALPGVTSVIGNSHKHQLADLVLADLVLADMAFRDLTLENVSPAHSGFVPVVNLMGTNIQTPEADLRRHGFEAQLFISDIFAHTELLAAPVFESSTNSSHNGDRTRPNLKIQDGCDNRCSFCVIPSVRGQSRSLQPSRVIHEINTLVAAGYREIVISGINLGRWGRDFNREGGIHSPESRSRKPTFENLLRTILEETQLEKLRISSVEPMDWSDDLISLVASSPRIAKHAHIPLQSGSDAVLRRMHRKYRPWHYREKIEKIHASMPTAAIGADVMVGFPGETAAEFESTRRLIADLPFTYLHVFTFSARPGTPAAAMPNQVPVQVARERNKILRDLAASKKEKFMQSFVGKKLDAITLSAVHAKPEGESTEALTDNYQKLFLRGRHHPNRWIKVRIDQVEDGAMLGSAMAA